MLKLSEGLNSSRAQNFLPCVFITTLTFIEKVATQIFYWIFKCFAEILEVYAKYLKCLQSAWHLFPEKNVITLNNIKWKKRAETICGQNHFLLQTFAVGSWANVILMSARNRINKLGYLSCWQCWVYFTRNWKPLKEADGL